MVELLKEHVEFIFKDDADKEFFRELWKTRHQFYVKNYVFQLSNGKMGVFGNLTKETFGNMLDDQKQKNGFAFAALNFAKMNESFNQMNEKCKNYFSNWQSINGIKTELKITKAQQRV